MLTAPSVGIVAAFWFSPAVPETRAHDGKVELEKRQLLAERHFLHCGVTERQAQQAGQIGQHPVGRRWVAVDQGGDRLQRVEQKVWLQLRPQVLELRGAQRTFQARLFPVVLDRVDHADRRPVGEHVSVEPAEQHVGECAGGRRTAT